MYCKSSKQIKDTLLFSAFWPWPHWKSRQGYASGVSHPTPNAFQIDNEKEQTWGVDSIISTYIQRMPDYNCSCLMSIACSRCYQPLYESRSPFYGLASHSRPRAKCLPGWRLCSSPLTLWNIPPRSSSRQGLQLDIEPVMIEEDDSRKERREGKVSDERARWDCKVSLIFKDHIEQCWWFPTEVD